MKSLLERESFGKINLIAGHPDSARDRLHQKVVHNLRLKLSFGARSILIIHHRERSHNPALESGLFPYLSERRFFNGLSGIKFAFRERPIIITRPVDQQYAPISYAFLDDDTSRGDDFFFHHCGLP